MIVVDSSVWISLFREQMSDQVAKLKVLLETPDLLLGDLILMELLQGARDEKLAAAIELRMREFSLARMLDEHVARAAARNFRQLRRLGVTVRKTNDLIIAAFCIENGHALLHADLGFASFEEHLGLTTV